MIASIWTRTKMNKNEKESRLCKTLNYTQLHSFAIETLVNFYLDKIGQKEGPTRFRNGRVANSLPLSLCFVEDKTTYSAVLTTNQDKTPDVGMRS